MLRFEKHRCRRIEAVSSSKNASAKANAPQTEEEPKSAFGKDYYPTHITLILKVADDLGITSEVCNAMIHKVADQNLELRLYMNFIEFGRIKVCQLEILPYSPVHPWELTIKL